jgi:hypothetical protein
MAGTVEHLAVALSLLRHWDDSVMDELGICCRDRFLLGNICPDGIMSRKGYERPMKMHTHFRDDIPDYEFAKQENLTLFHQRIVRFVHSALEGKKIERELVLGYLTHILTDEIFMLTVRPSFLEKISVLQLTDRDAATFEYFTDDVNQIDFRLAREYPGMEWAKECLRKAEPYEIPGMVTQEELTKSRQWILEFYFQNAPLPKNPVYYTYEQALEFIRTAVSFIDVHIREYIL